LKSASSIITANQPKKNNLILEREGLWGGKTAAKGRGRGTNYLGARGETEDNSFKKRQGGVQRKKIGGGKGKGQPQAGTRNSILLGRKRGGKKKEERGKSGKKKVAGPERKAKKTTSPTGGPRARSPLQKGTTLQKANQVQKESLP